MKIKKIISFSLSIVIATCVFIKPALAAEHSQNIMMLSDEGVNCSGNVVPFDREEVYDNFYQSISENNPNLSEPEIVALANDLVEAALTARNQMLSSPDSQGKNSVSLGRIVDGKLVEEETESSITTVSAVSESLVKSTIPYSEYITLDSRTGIVSHGFSVTPYQTSKVQWMTHGEWQGINHYTVDAYGAWNCSSSYSISKTLGYTGTLYASDAKAYGLSAASTDTTYTQKVTPNDSFMIDPWTAKYIRPIILWHLASYSATYEFYCYNSFENSYSYKTVNLSGENATFDLKENQEWVKVNAAEDPNAVLPSLPSGFWLE